MRRWKPAASAYIWIALVLLLGVLGGTGYLLGRLLAALTGPPAEWVIGGSLLGELVGFMLLAALAGLLAYRVAGALTLAYAVDRNGLYVFWLGNRAVVPISRIERVEQGARPSFSLRKIWQSIGYLHGRSRLRDGTVVHRFTNRSLRRSLIVYTTDGAYALSPHEADAFVQEMEQRRRLGPIQQLSLKVEHGRLFFYAFWQDSFVRWALVSALLANLAVVAVLMLIYASLPADLPLRVVLGMPSELRPRHQILFLPLAALGLALLNILIGLLIYRREPNGARLLQMTSLVLQILFGVAALTIVLVAV
jgi:hypothetical protein